MCSVVGVSAAGRLCSVHIDFLHRQIAYTIGSTLYMNKGTLCTLLLSITSTTSAYNIQLGCMETFEQSVVCMNARPGMGRVLAQTRAL